MLKVGIIGVSGYAGEKLLDILLKHSEVKISYLAAKTERKENISKIFPRLKGRISLECDNRLDKERAVKLCELLFLALPHTVSLQFVPYLLKKGTKVIDLSADYRLKNINIYEQFYKAKHLDRGNLKKAVYGLAELYRVKIKSARLVANPGCYPTAAILALAPLLKNNLIKPESIVIDVKSGFSGAGRENVDRQKKEILNNFKAYKVNIHQHIPEINQEFSILYGRKIDVTFVPHVLPIERGILETIYVKKSQKSQPQKLAGQPIILAEKLKSQKLISLYKDFYRDEPFIRIKEAGDFPQLKDVIGTNFCDMGMKNNGDTVIVIVAIDNLIKGASGQAVQNMNIMYGFAETKALI